MTKEQATRVRQGRTLYYQHAVYGWLKGAVTAKKLVDKGRTYVIKLDVEQPHRMVIQAPHGLLHTKRPR